MPVEIRKVDTLQTRLYNSFVNLTRQDSTKYPALTTTRIEPNYLPDSTRTDLLTSYTIYDQFALRIWSNSQPLSAQ